MDLDTLSTGEARELIVWIMLGGAALCVSFAMAQVSRIRRRSR